MSGEEYWRTSSCPDFLLDIAKLNHLLGRRKSRLFVCGCYRLVWSSIHSSSIREAVQRAEERADGIISQAELETYRDPGVEPGSGRIEWQLALSVRSLVTKKVVPGYLAWLTRRAFDMEKYWVRSDLDEHLPQAELVRDLFGNPFRPVAFSPNWRTTAALALAQSMYESRDFAAVPILADALEEAGCDEPDILAHCRGPGPHVRGCWVVDLVLGKT